ncbi:hypothetical protein J27TS8_20740 [Robertmurraya siralis]|uniref:Cytosolic protein n=1 Tax=Robertmurraya siralis TaxID=77777 RepID=A0A919WHG5_9BACI|nr:hypothetical protein [Robertmurraya siralis]GIN62081.1 hypothetical protein J27TS8_20740 [Robertmurraya siralis]
MAHKRNEQYQDFSNVEKQREVINAEEFPEGPFGSPIAQQKPVQNKDGDWQKGQRSNSGFTYENRTLHEDTPRQMEGSHPIHDKKDE